MDPYTSATHPSLSKSSSRVLSQFLATRDDATEEEHYTTLCALRPDRLTLSDLASIVNWIENNVSIHQTYPNHVNVFGTGGDSTLNISSMAAILASRFVRIVKVGTYAVTSRYGSADFFSALDSYLNTQSASPVRSRMRFAKGSTYLRLSDIGFPYNESLRKARNRLRANRVPDIYKVVFPFSDYTHPSIQINGVSNITYLNIYRQLAVHLGRSVCLLHSSHNIDELMPGANRIIFASPNHFEEFEWTFCTSASISVSDIFRETQTLGEALSLFEEALTNRGDNILYRTLIHNAGLIVAAQNWNHPFRSFSLALQSAVTSIDNELNSAIP